MNTELKTKEARPLAGRGTAVTLPHPFREVANALDGLHFGTIELTVHDGKVVQIERKEKIRFAVGAGKEHIA